MAQRVQRADRLCEIDRQKLVDDDQFLFSCTLALEFPKKNPPPKVLGVRCRVFGRENGRNEKMKKVE